jgi:hypothetical protein
MLRTFEPEERDLDQNNHWDDFFKLVFKVLEVLTIQQYKPLLDNKSLEEI